MSVKSPWTIDIPAIDVLSYIFDPSLPVYDFPLFQNADDPGDYVTKAELKKLVQKIGGGLKARHRFEDEDVAMVCAENSVSYPSLYLGTLCADGIFCGANPNSRPQELLRNVEITCPKVIFTELSVLPLIEQTLDIYKGPKPSIYLLEKKSEYGTHQIYHHLSDSMEYGEYEWKRLSGIDTVSNRVALLGFSSGTTGLPKACALTHYNLVATAEQRWLIENVHSTPEEKANYALSHTFCAALPMYHMPAMVTNVHVNCRTGAPLIILRGYTLPRLVRTIQRYKVTNLLMVPTIANSLAKSHLDLASPLSSLKHLVCGASSLGVEAAANFKRVFKRADVFVQQTWGMTEATASATLFDDKGESDGNTVGYLLPNMEARIINSNGEHVGYGKMGEAVLRGPNIFPGYWKNERATNESRTADGWLRTGDTLVVNQDQLFSVVGREKELIKVKGYQVSPGELESALMDFDGVKDCAVIRVYRDGKECPQAHIVRKDPSITERSILEFMETRTSSYKRLTGGIFFTESIPRSGAGKILRRDIKDAFPNHGIPQYQSSRFNTIDLTVPIFELPRHWRGGDGIEIVTVQAGGRSNNKITIKRRIEQLE